MRLIKDAGGFLGWGLGLDARSDLDEFLPKFDLLGTRERRTRFIDDKKVFYVPCASCMHEEFSLKEECLTGEGALVDGNRIALHFNGGFNSADVVKSFGKSEVPTTSTVDPFEKIIANLRGADCVVTNSYHGAYWASLLGKKVICIKTEVPKWDGLSDRIVFCEVGGIRAAVETAENVPGSYLDECRDLNRGFYLKVMQIARVCQDL